MSKEIYPKGKSGQDLNIEIVIVLLCKRKPLSKTSCVNDQWDKLLFSQFFRIRSNNLVAGNGKLTNGKCFMRGQI